MPPVSKSSAGPEPAAAKPRYSEGREALIDAAARVFTAEGVGGLTYRAVAREAGVTHGLVNYHFGSREMLVRAALARVAQESIEASAILPESGRLEDFARELPALTRRDPESATAQFDLAVQARRRADLMPEVRALYERYIDVCAEAMERFGVDADPASARVVFAALDGLIMQQLIFGKPAETEASLAVLRRFIDSLSR